MQATREYLFNLPLNMKQAIWGGCRYLASLQWTLVVQKICKFCHHENFKKIIYKRGRIIVVENICSSGEKHWLIMPNKPRELKRPRKHKPTRHKIRKIREIRVPLSRPKRMWKHVRDIESLNYSHYGLRERQHHQSCIRQKRSINKYVFLPNKAVCEMDAVKHYILKKYCPHIPLSEVHSGYHRGRRPLIGSIYYPDIISVHHLHLHVIVRPQWRRKWLRYALPLMWKSDEKVLLKVKEQASKRKKLLSALDHARCERLEEEIERLKT